MTVRTLKTLLNTVPEHYEVYVSVTHDNGNNEVGIQQGLSDFFVNIENEDVDLGGTKRGHE